MSAQDLNRVHRRYIVVSNTFKSAWTFHQFIQGLRKVFTEVPTSDYPADFQGIYSDLKLVSENLSETSSTTASAQLDEVETRLVPLVQDLLTVDMEVSPGLLRQFFQRVKNFDHNIVTQLVKFYLYSREEGDWNLDRLDKADFLATKVAEEYNDNRGTFALRDRTQVREMGQGFWAALAADPVSSDRVESICHEVKALEEEIHAIESIDEMNAAQLIQRYREFKHRLGDAFFQPRVWRAILDANLALKNHVQQLYRRDEQRIIAEYQHVFELERDVPVDVQLGEELSQFRDAVERFESQLQGENVRLSELADLREKVRELVPKLRPESVAETPLVAPSEVREVQTPRVAGFESELEKEYIEETYEAIVSALDDTNPTVDPKRIALQPEIFSLGLSPREVIAYRRLFGAAPCDHSLELFVLRGAALRALIEQEVEEIKGILDDTAATRDTPIFDHAAKTVRLGDLFLRRYEHRIEQAVLGRDGSDARALQVLRVRMMRAFSGLWLMVYRT